MKLGRKLKIVLHTFEKKLEFCLSNFQIWYKTKVMRAPKLYETARNATT